MKLFCCFTPAHEVLLRDYFLPSVPAAVSVTATRLEIEGRGDFLSPEFLRCILKKLDLIVASIRENLGELIAWSDIDIQFFEVTADDLRSQLGPHDIAFQREGRNMPDVNAGFFVCRCNPEMARFFEQVKERLRQSPSVNEQWVINQLLRENPAGISWTYLPFTYYARTHGWPPPRRLALYHANATAGDHGVQRKIQQFRELAFLRRFGVWALIVTSLKYAPRRISRLLSERRTRART